MNRLIFFMVGIGNEDRAQSIEGQDAIGFWVLNARALIGWLQALVVAFGAMDGPRHITLEQPLLDTRHDGTHGATLLEPLFEVARFVQLRV